MEATGAMVAAGNTGAGGTTGGFCAGAGARTESNASEASVHIGRECSGGVRYAPRMRDFLRNAFALGDGKPCEPSPEDRAMLERLAAEVARRRMTGPALAFLEMSRPLNAIGAAAIHFFTPLASMLANPDAAKRFAEFLEQRGSIDVLCELLEAAEKERVGETGVKDPTH